MISTQFEQPNCKNNINSRQNRNLLTPTGGGYSSGNEERSQSAFPIPTPDRLGPLTDLLEEDDQTPLDSRENSGRRRTDWSFLPRPKTPGSTTSSSESYVSSNWFISIFMTFEYF